MFRKTVLAVAATAVIGVASLSPASAHGYALDGRCRLRPRLLGAFDCRVDLCPLLLQPGQLLQPRQIMTRHGYLRTVMVNVCE